MDPAASNLKHRLRQSKSLLRVSGVDIRERFWREFERLLRFSDQNELMRLARKTDPEWRQRIVEVLASKLASQGSSGRKFMLRCWTDRYEARFKARDTEGTWEQIFAEVEQRVVEGSR